MLHTLKLVRLPDLDWMWQSSLTFPATKRSPPWVFWLNQVVCVIVCVCVCEEGSKRVRGRLTENRKYTFARMKRLIFSRSQRCPYSLSAFGNHTAKRGGDGVCICNLCQTEEPSAHSALPHNNLWISSLIFPSCGALTYIMFSMPFQWPNGLVHPMQLMAPAHHTWPQDVRINLTAPLVEQNGPPLPFDVPSLVWNLFTIVWWMLFVLFLAGALKGQVLTVHRHNHAHTDTSWNQVFIQMPHLQLWLWHLARENAITLLDTNTSYNTLCTTEQNSCLLQQRTEHNLKVNWFLGKQCTVLPCANTEKQV